MKSVIKVSFIVFLISMMFHSCRKEGCTDASAINYNNKAKKDDGSCVFAKDCENTSYTYQTDIKPIIDAHCVSCHQYGGAGFSAAQLDNYSGVKASATTGKLLDAINHRPGASNMPQGSAKLSAENIKKIECWVEKGSPEE